MVARKRIARDNKVHDSTGNVFEDLGLPDAEKRLAKAELARASRSTAAGSMTVKTRRTVKGSARSSKNVTAQAARKAARRVAARKKS